MTIAPQLTSSLLGETGALQAYLDIVAELPEYRPAATAGTVVVLLAQGEAGAAVLHALSLTPGAHEGFIAPYAALAGTAGDERARLARRLVQDLEGRGIRGMVAAVMDGLMALPTPLAAGAIRLWSAHAGELLEALGRLAADLRRTATASPRYPGNGTAWALTR